LKLKILSTAHQNSLKHRLRKSDQANREVKFTSNQPEKDSDMKKVSS